MQIALKIFTLLGKIITHATLCCKTTKELLETVVELGGFDALDEPMEF